MEIPRYPGEPSKPQKMSLWLVIAPSSGMIVMALGMALIFKNHLYAVIMITVGLTYALINILRQREQQKRYQESRQEIQKAYVNRLQEIEEDLRRRQEGQQAYLRTVYPEADEIAGWIEGDSPRIWERSWRDEDFLDLRLGTGEVRSSYSIEVPKVDIPELAPPQLLEAREMAMGYQSLADAPIRASLASDHAMAIIGPAGLRESLGRSLLCQIAGLHAPDELEIFAVYPSNKIEAWEWLKWLPHARALTTESALQHLAYEPDVIRQVYSGLLDLLDQREIKGEYQDRRDTSLVLFVADPELIEGEAILQRILDRGRELRVSLILLSPNAEQVPEGFSTRITILSEQEAALYQSAREDLRIFKPDYAGKPLAERLARGLAPFQVGESRSPTALPEEIRLLELAGCPDLEYLDLESRWAEAQSHPPSLKVPIGMRHGKRPLIVDLKQSGAGPHGLIAGTTGSGKSELLLTLLTGLAIEHHPHQVNFVLIDYKGGTAMNVLRGLPHTVGMATDLDGKQTRRALIALGSEMERREAILTRYQVADIDKYHQLGISEPFPYLFIVIDEFAELRDRFRDDLAEILREFVSVAQKGRALGVHLILAMQRPEGVVNDSIRANMKYRICLRVERAEDSRNVLARPDAYLLPHQPPGRAYFQVGKDEQFDLFQVARVAGYVQKIGYGNGCKETLRIREVGPDGRRIPLFEVAPSKDEEGEAPSIIQTEAQRIVEKAKAAAQRLGISKLASPWPAPLPERLALDRLYRDLGLPQWDGKRWPEQQNWPAVPVGLLDEPIKQRQRPFLCNPVEDGNLIVVGAPGSGRTNCLLSLVTSLTLSLSPDWVHFHLLDFAGHQLSAALSKFPHIAGIYERSEIERIRRLLSVLDWELEERKRRFAEAGVVSLSAYRRARPDEPPLPLILTAINGFSGFYEAFLEEIAGWNRQLREGSSYGLHYLITTDSIPTGRTMDLIPNRITLRLPDRTWYSLILGGRPDLITYDPLPGRGFVNTKPPTELQIAMPLDATPEAQIAELQALGREMSETWQGARPQPIRILAEHISLEELLPENLLESFPIRDDFKAWIGVDHDDLRPVLVDFANLGSSLLISGPPESGKTTTLITLALSLAATHHPDRIRMAFVSLKSGEQGAWVRLSGLPHASSLISSYREFEEFVSELEQNLKDELERGASAAARPAHRVLFLDDYQLLLARSSSAMSDRLEAILRRGTEGGITVLVALPTQALSTTADSFARRLKAGRTGIWLRSTDGLEAQMVGASIPMRMRGKPMPAGRGFFYHPAGQALLQIASADMEGGEGAPDEVKLGNVQRWVEEIRRCVQKEDPSKREGSA